MDPMRVIANAFVMFYIPKEVYAYNQRRAGLLHSNIILRHFKPKTF